MPPAISRFSFSKYSSFILFLIIAAYLVNGIFYLNAQSLTSDEAGFYNYAVRYLKGQPERIRPVMDNSKMPVVALNTIPRITEEFILHNDVIKDGGTHDIVNGRYITLFVSMLSIFLVFTWAKELYGVPSGLFSAFIFSLCPNNLANAALVTTDAYSVLFLLSTFYFFWKFCNKQDQKYFLLFTFSIALSQLVKQSLFHLYVLTPICFLLFYSFKKSKAYWAWSLFFKRLAIFVVINLLVVNAGYYFHKSFLRLDEYHFMSDLFKTVQNIFPSWLPIPFPKPFIDGLDMTKYYDQVGGGTPISSFGNVTVLGASATGEGIWYYYFVSLFFKTPIAYSIFFFWSVWFSYKKRNSSKFMQNEFFLLAPIIYYLVTMSFFYKTQCGIRHILFMFPLLAIFFGSIIPNIKTAGQKFILAGTTLFLFISVLSYWKNYYPYTNEFILDKKSAYRFVGSQNLDFLQGGYFLNQYLSIHKDVKLAPRKNQPGIYVIAIHDYMDTWNRHQYDWIKCYRPVGHVAHDYLIIDAQKPCINP
jgi:hypothetical protein